VPQKLRISPESLAKDATTLSGQVQVSHALSFRFGSKSGSPA
jgi:hypothetical protein